MKITKSQLKQIIQEELDALQESDKLGAFVNETKLNTMKHYIEKTRLAIDRNARAAGVTDQVMARLANDISEAFEELVGALERQ